MTKYNNYNHFMKIFSDNYMSYLDNEKIELDFNDLFNNKYSMIVAEPGYGKTRLLKELVLRAQQNNKNVYFIDAKKIKDSIVDSLENCKLIDNAINEETLQKQSFISNIETTLLDDKTIICLDALDELPFSNLHNFFEKLESFINETSEVHIVLSCRIHHIKKIEYDISKMPFEYITLDNFLHEDIIDYLRFNGVSQQNVKEIEQKSQLSNLWKYLSIPRYLYYFQDIIKNKSIDEIISLSRNEIFEEFIYRKINKERDGKYPESEVHIIKRVLEELALVMKIYQVSQISKDDFFTIFKELNLGNIFTGEALMEKLTERSLLKDNIDYLEFENQEFLDYLASKELNRFEKVDQVFFDLAVESHIQEVFTSWFYVMPFVLENNHHLIELLLNFIERNSQKVLRQAYFEVLTNIDSKLINNELKSKIFNIIFDYYNSQNQWLRLNRIINFYLEDEHYKKIVEICDSNLDDNMIKVRNCIEILEELSKNDLLNIEKIKNWQDKFFDWLSLDKKKYKNLHVDIINCSVYMMKNDFDWVKKIKFIFDDGISLQHEYSRLCYKIAPNDKFSIDIYFECDRQFKKNQLDRASRLDDNVKYICKVNNKKSLKYILQKLIDDVLGENIQYLLNEAIRDRYQNDFKTFSENIEQNLDEKMLDLLQEFHLKILIETRIKYNENGHHVFKLFFNLLTKHIEKYNLTIFKNMLELLNKKEIYIHDLEYIIYTDLLEYLNKKEFVVIHSKLAQLYEAIDRNMFNRFIYDIYLKEQTKNSIKKEIEKTYAQEIKEAQQGFEKYRDKEERDKRNRQLGLCRQWEHKIEPEPGKFVTDLFKFYSSNKEALKLCDNFENNRDKTTELAKDVIKHNNPLSGKVEVNGNGATIYGVHYFKDIINLFYEENISFDTQNEQDLIDNIFRYLPFDINSDYESTLKLAKKPSQDAINDILDVYSGKRDDDLGIYHPSNFLEIYKQTTLKEAEPLLLDMISILEIEKWVREEIIKVLPKNILTKEKINAYISKHSEDDELYESMLIALIEEFNDTNAFKIAFNNIKDKGVNTEISENESSIHGTPLDLDRTYNILAHTLINIDYDLEYDKKFLEEAIKLRRTGKHINSNFFEEIVFNHLKYMNYKKSFEPILELEKFLQKNGNNNNLTWFKYKFEELKNIYLEQIAKPKHILSAITLYKKTKENEYLDITSNLHFLELVKECIEKEIKHWIENEGAYKHIEELAKKDKNLNAEDFIQKTLKSQIELALIKRGFRATDLRIKREEQTLDDKRVDFTISYGFVGQILLEFKLSHSNDATDGKNGQEYKNTLKHYIEGTKSDFGLFVIFNIRHTKETFQKRIAKLNKLYEDEKNIYVLGISCK